MNDSIIIREILANQGTAHVDDDGAHLLDWTPRGALPVLWRPAALELRPGKPIRGGIPIIAPWFGAGVRDGAPAGFKPFHSFARISRWTAADPAPGSLSYLLDSRSLPAKSLAPLAVEPTDPSRIRFQLRYTIACTQRLDLRLELANQSECPLAIEMAFHTYLRVGDVGHVTVDGLEQAPYFDAKEGRYRDADHAPLRIRGAVDRVYGTRLPVSLRDPDLERRIDIASPQATQAIVWNPGEDGDAMDGIGPGQWRRFVCIEAARCREGRQTVQPGAVMRLEQSITVTGYGAQPLL